MIEQPLPARVVATLWACEQYGYRVELPDSLDGEIRDDILRRAMWETTNTFLECTRKYQAVAWAGNANLAFAGSPASPSDRKSKFLHALICLKTIELSILHHRETTAEPLMVHLGNKPLWDFRKKLLRLCEKYGLELPPASEVSPEPDAENESEPDGPEELGYCGATSENETFVPELNRKLKVLERSVKRSLTAFPPLRWLAGKGIDCLALLVAIYQVIFRCAFSCYYRSAANRIMKRMDGPNNVFLYFEIRSGRNRDARSYLAWKYSEKFTSMLPEHASPIPFTHLPRTNAPFSFAAMIWARQALLQMKKQPLDGCVVVNFLFTPMMLWKLRVRKRDKGLRMRKRLRDWGDADEDFISGLIYQEFRNALIANNSFALELGKSYQQFFSALAPGVVIQADALSKGARQFTTNARRRGCQVIYVADRICTRLRTSNQLIADDGDNPHFPDRCVVFDGISRDELIRQGFAANRIYHYHRNFGAHRSEKPRSHRPRKILVLLQDHMDHLSVLIAVGAEIARTIPEVKIIFQEHPDFPVGEEVKSRLIHDAPGRLRFLGRGKKVDYTDVMAVVTGYSTAAISGVLQGAPLIWMRRQIDNSVYGADYLERIGFAADSHSDALAILRRLLALDPQTVADCATATAAAHEIFASSAEGSDRPLAATLEQALSDSFSEISGQSPRVAVDTGVMRELPATASQTNANP